MYYCPVRPTATPWLNVHFQIFIISTFSIHWVSPTPLLFSLLCACLLPISACLDSLLSCPVLPPRLSYEQSTPESATVTTHSLTTTLSSPKEPISGCSLDSFRISANSTRSYSVLALSSLSLLDHLIIPVFCFRSVTIVLHGLSIENWHFPSTASLNSRSFRLFPATVLPTVWTSSPSTHLLSTLLIIVFSNSPLHNCCFTNHSIGLLKLYSLFLHHLIWLLNSYYHLFSFIIYSMLSSCHH